MRRPPQPLDLPGGGLAEEVGVGRIDPGRGDGAAELAGEEGGLFGEVGLIDARRPGLLEKAGRGGRIPGGERATGQQQGAEAQGGGPA